MAICKGDIGTGYGGLVGLRGLDVGVGGWPGGGHSLLIYFCNTQSPSPSHQFISTPSQIIQYNSNKTEAYHMIDECDTKICCW